MAQKRRRSRKKTKKENQEQKRGINWLQVMNPFGFPPLQIKSGEVIRVR